MTVITRRAFVAAAEWQARTDDGTTAGWLTKMNDVLKEIGLSPNPLDPKAFFGADLHTVA